MPCDGITTTLCGACGTNADGTTTGNPWLGTEYMTGGLEFCRIPALHPSCPDSYCQMVQNQGFYGSLANAGCVAGTCACVDTMDGRIYLCNKFKAIGMGGKKTDKKDARALADALRLNFIPEVHHKSEYARNLKSLIVSREQLVRTRVNFVNHIRGTLREYGITMPQGMEAFWKHVEKCLQEVKNGHIQKSLMDMLEMIGKVEEQETELMQAIKEYVKNDARFERLQTIPGVGPLGGLALMAVIDDCSRFKNSKHFASYLGLVPREHSSGDKRRMGSITRSGSEIVRRYLIHGARAVLLHTKDDTKDPNRAWALRLKGRIGMNKAVVALAHRMARIAFNVLTNETTYTDRPRKTSPDKLKEKAA